MEKAEIKALIKKIQTGKNAGNLLTLKEKALAIASGKGGVGKTTTAANLSLYAARKGLRTALLDLDPLSDITTILDLSESEKILEKSNIQQTGKQESLSQHRIKVFNNLDLLFPASKLKKGESIDLFTKIFTVFAEELNASYDLLIFDLPAGLSIEDNQIYLPFMKKLILVTNPEPTAHVSAGAYLKQAIDDELLPLVEVWHNKYRAFSASRFHSSDIVKNYNSNMPEDRQLDEAVKENLNSIAFVPADPSLDLLKTSITMRLTIERSLDSLLEQIYREYIAHLYTDKSLGPAARQWVLSYFAKNTRIKNIDEYLKEFGAYLIRIITENINPGIEIDAKSIFSEEQYNLVKKFLEEIQQDRLAKAINIVRSQIHQQIALQETANNPFAVQNGIDQTKNIDQGIASLLGYISNLKKIHNPEVTNLTGVLVFYFSMYKLVQSPTVTKIIQDFIPSKMTSKGKKVRDRKQQILWLVENNSEYRKKYFGLIKTLNPVMLKQLQAIIVTFSLQALVFKDPDHKINTKAYIKLLSNFLHELINSGLGIVIGFDYREAATAFKRGADKALEFAMLNAG